MTIKDIQNMKSSVKELTYKGLQHAQLVLDHLQKALEEDESACGGVAVDEVHTVPIRCKV